MWVGTLGVCGLLCLCQSLGLVSRCSSGLVFTIGVIASPLPIWLGPGATPVLLYPHRSHPCPLARLAGSDPLLQDTNRAPCLCVTFPRVPFHKIHGTK